jgi:uncharacterized damage-inducible protein DinB
MKHFISLVLLFSLTTLLAQNPTAEALLADFERGKALSLAYIDAMPEEAFDFRPGEGSRSFAEQWLHVAQGMIGLSANGTGAEKIYPDQNLEKTPEFQSKPEVRRLVSESFDFAIAGIKNLDPSTYQEVVVRGPFKVTRVNWVRKAKEHTDHHRGQTAVYLRVKGIIPPQYQLF